MSLQGHTVPGWRPCPRKGDRKGRPYSVRRRRGAAGGLVAGRKDCSLDVYGRLHPGRGQASPLHFYSLQPYCLLGDRVECRLIEHVVAPTFLPFKSRLTEHYQDQACWATASRARASLAPTFHALRIHHPPCFSASVEISSCFICKTM